MKKYILLFLSATALASCAPTMTEPTIPSFAKNLVKGQKWEVEAYTQQGKFVIPFEIGNTYDRGLEYSVGYLNNARSKSSLSYTLLNNGRNDIITFIWLDELHNVYGYCSLRSLFKESNQDLMTGYLTYSIESSENYYLTGSTAGMGGCIIRKKHE